MTLPEITERLIAFEVESGICARRVGGFSFWDVLRMRYFYAIAVKLGTYDYPHRAEPGGLARKLVEAAEDVKLFIRLWRELPECGEAIVFCNSRRKLDPASGRWIDPYCDPVIDSLSPKPYALETRFGREHLRPASTRRLGYYDLAVHASRILTALLLPFWRPTRRESRELGSLEQRLKSAFGYAPSLARDAVRARCAHTALKHVFRILLRRSRATRAFLVCSYGQEALVEACRSLGIRTIELQHGTISRHHLGYHYPSGTDKRYVPDEYWAFGPYWVGKVNFPARMRVRPDCGFPYLEERIGEFGSRTKGRRLLVISQGTVGVELARFLLAALDAIPPDVEVVFKLHPGEVAGWKERFIDLAARGDRVRVIDGAEPDLYALLAESEWQLGVNSTALYEGMRLGCRTILAPLPGVEYMEDLVSTGDAILVRSPADFALALESCPRPHGEGFFSHQHA